MFVEILVFNCDVARRYQTTKTIFLARRAFGYGLPTWRKTMALGRVWNHFFKELSLTAPKLKFFGWWGPNRNGWPMTWLLPGMQQIV